MLGHVPAGTSTKTVIHYAQEIHHDGNFQQFDYGPQGNIAKYGTPTPPLYKLEKIKTPIYLMYSYNDWLASYIVSLSKRNRTASLHLNIYRFQDVLRLAQNLTNLIGTYRIPLETFNHVDFIWGMDAPTMVYKPLLKVIRNYTENVSNGV